MYIVRDPGVGLMPPEVWANPGTPSVPKVASMVLPTGEMFVGDEMANTGLAGADLAGAELAGGVNWSQFGTDMLKQGIKDTTSVIGAGLKRVGKTRVSRTPQTVVGTRAPEPELVYPEYAPPPPKQGLPTWAWAVIGIGGVAVIGGAAFFLLRRKGT
jgi:hypothetical protein